MAMVAGNHRRADALDSASGNEEGTALGKPRCQRGQAEDGPADQNQALETDDVAHLATGRGGPGEDQHIGTDHPVRRDLGHAEIPPHGWQRDADHGLVQHDQPRGRAHGDQDPPLTTLIIDPKHRLSRPGRCCLCARAPIRSLRLTYTHRPS
jgi:hypothetical protein